MTTKEAHAKLKGTYSKDKNQILFNQFAINYNNEPEICKRGSILIRVFNKKMDKKRMQKLQGKSQVDAGHFGDALKKQKIQDGEDELAGDKL